MVTVACALPLPPAPSQVSVNVDCWLTGTEAEPDVARSPVQPPLAVQDVAPVDDHVIVVVLPMGTVIGLALTATVGALTPTDT
jgi:hypothetical protein